jgi:hypothetical protein
MQNLSSASSETTRIEVDVSEFTRGEISVKLRRDNTLLVHALHLDQFASDNFFRKELVKTFPLPAGADADKIRSVIRNSGILTIDIPMLRDNDAIRRSHEELLKTIDQPLKSTKTDYNRSASHADVTKSNQQPTRPPPLTVPKRTSSLGDIEYRQTPQTPLKFNIADFLQSQFRPTFAHNGKKLILKVDTRGYEPDEEKNLHQQQKNMKANNLVKVFVYQMESINIMLHHKLWKMVYLLLMHLYLIQ